MAAIILEANKNGHYPEQCGKTMTVRELIEYLRDLDEDYPVYISNDNGYTYGSINIRDFEEKDFDEDEEQ